MNEKKKKVVQERVRQPLQLARGAWAWGKPLAFCPDGLPRSRIAIYSGALDSGGLAASRILQPAIHLG